MLKRSALISLVILFVLTITPATAQDDEIAITLRASQFTEELFRELADQFEAENPGVRVEIETFNGIDTPISTFDNIEDYLEDFAEYAASADVFPVDNRLKNYATRAGYLLDLAPIINSDTSINSADYRQSMWNAFRWDGGMWALPVSGSINNLFYDPSAFDEAGLTYPDENWTMDDLANAIRTLTRVDSDGNITTPGLLIANLTDDLIAALFISLLGHIITDSSTIPANPDLSDPQIAELLNAWAELQAEGLINPPIANLGDTPIPLAFGGTFLATGLSAQGNNTLEPATLPGGRVGMDINGYAISSGSQHPEVAYELIKFLSTSPNAVNTFFASTPARYDLDMAEDNEISSGGVTFSIAGATDNPELEAFVESAIEQAITPAETLYIEAIVEAFAAMTEDGLSATDALQSAENTLLTNLEIADEQRNTPIFVNPPAPLPVLAEGEIALNFAATGFITPFPNEDQWQAFAEAFAANDPEVGIVNLETTFPGGLSDLSEQYDCFYTPNNLIPGADVSVLRNLDPLISADPNFNPDDFVSGALEQVQLNNQTWGMPITIEPEVLRYNADLFAQAGVPLPENGWTVTEFEDALSLLARNLELEGPPFVANQFGGNSYLLNLIVAYGGLPIDTRTNPPTINFTDPATVNAIQEVLDLARAGLLEYNELVTVLGNTMSISIGEESENPIYSETLNGFGLGGGLIFINAESDDAALPQNPDRLTTYPSGSQINAVIYGMGVAYISANTTHTEACYRFIQQLAQNPDLFSSMPARRSLINDPALASAQTPDLITFFQQMDTLLSQPNTITLPAGSGRSLSADIRSHWLNRVFDGYVADEITDLESALAEAETYTRAYQDCIADIPIFNPTQVEDPQTYFQQFTDCAVEADPSSAEFFPN